jgi:hypothetical protein
MFVVPDVCRYTVHGTIGGRQTANILDYKITASGVVTATRPEAIDAMAGIIINEVRDSWLPRISNLWSFNSVSWIDLNTPDGVTGERNSSGAYVLPKPGTSALSAMPPNVSILVRKVIDRKRGAKNGRMYIPGVTEGETPTGASGAMDSTPVTAWQTQMTAFLGDTNQTGGIIAGQPYDSKMVVSHILTREPPKKLYTDGSVAVPGDPLTGEGLVVRSLLVQSLLATQRRRLRG